MVATVCADPAPIPPPSHPRTMATALHLDALTLVARFHLLEMCCVAVRLAHKQCASPLPTGPADPRGSLARNRCCW